MEGTSQTGVLVRCVESHVFMAKLLGCTRLGKFRVAVAAADELYGGRVISIARTAWFSPLARGRRGEAAGAGAAALLFARFDEPALGAIPVAEEGVHHHEVEGVRAGPAGALHACRHVRHGHIVFAEVHNRATVS